jgi:hypothetical protein
MENEIKVGEYIRTKLGDIKKITEGFEFIIKRYNESDNKIVKHSPNLKDLIQKDDFVNGDRVVAIDYTEDENGNYVDVLGIMEIDDDYAYPIELRVINIQEVVTKEMMESISYRVKE